MSTAVVSSSMARVVASLFLLGAAALLLAQAASGFVRDTDERFILTRPHRIGPFRHRVARDVTDLISGVRWSPLGGRSARSPAKPAAVKAAAAPVTLSALVKRAHNVGSGPVVLKSKKTIFIPKFTYDGAGPDVYFLVGKGTKVTHTGATKVPTPTGEIGPFRHRVARDVTDLISGVRWSPLGGRSARSPAKPAAEKAVAAPVTLSALVKRAHNVGSGPVVLKSKKTIFIPKFTYDGAGPDVYFLVGKGTKVTHTGATKVPTPTGELKVKKGYTGQDLTLTLPGSLTFNDVDWFAVYCISYQENFGDVRIPKNLNLPAA